MVFCIKKNRSFNKTHRLNGPAYIGYYKTGLIYSEAWYENNKIHRLNGPAEIWYYDTGLIEVEKWYENDIEQIKSMFLIITIYVCVFVFF